ncbi:hypothetical protein [Fimbriimonas ginsengisoli]|uniref:Lipoprotein n=1 Tax=Fimbriimonas ginsengisoli Gsoil 348 TaxID=661478 RepID=A0A068NJ64_FIMGI|nr:hypothetical protein [Fimbriimonas ginsengisoli]AIE83633.1 hypothetical protein OP10G_0265 [Fimbriimonas ginsengisoli Gsoil 348]
MKLRKQWVISVGILVLSMVAAGGCQPAEEPSNSPPPIKPGSIPPPSDLPAGMVKGGKGRK